MAQHGVVIGFSARHIIPHETFSATFASRYEISCEYSRRFRIQRLPFEVLHFLTTEEAQS
jgi:hypothetical protein